MLAFLEQTKNTPLLIQIALDEGDIDNALHLLKGMAKKDIYGYTYNDSYGYYGYSDIALEVAGAAEETRPREAIELYRQYAERLIAKRERKNYQQACTYLVKVRTLYEKLGEDEAWTNYVTTLRETEPQLACLKGRTDERWFVNNLLSATGRAELPVRNRRWARSIGPYRAFIVLYT